jgi:hypothetical protein
MRPVSLHGVLFTLGGALLVGFLGWLLYWKSKSVIDPDTRAMIREGQRPPGFLARGSLAQVISEPSMVLVVLALITSALWIMGVLLTLAHTVQSEHSRAWFQVGGLGIALLGGCAVLWWSLWSLLTSAEDRAHFTAVASHRVTAFTDQLLEKPWVVVLLYVVAIAMGVLMVADSVVSGRIIGWTLSPSSPDPGAFWGQIGVWVVMTGWVGARFLQELRKYFGKRKREPWE